MVDHLQVVQLHHLSFISTTLIDESQDMAVHVEEVIEILGDTDHRVAPRPILWTWEDNAVLQG